MSEGTLYAGREPVYLRLFLFCMLAFSLFNGAMIWRFRRPILEGYGDFTSFYTAGKIVAAGQSDRLYDRQLQWQLQQKFASEVKIRRGPLPFIRPPFEALLFLPLSYLGYSAAWTFWFGLKVLILFVVCRLLRLHGNSLSLRRQLLLCFAFFPVGFDLFEGQDSIILLLVLAITLRLLVERKDVASGAVLALGLCKFHITLPLFLIVALKRRRVTLGFLPAALGLALISLGMVHWDGLLGYPKHLWTLSHLSGAGIVDAQVMPNVRGMLTALSHGQSSGPLIDVMVMATATVAIGASVLLWREDSSASTVRGFSLCIPLILATGFYTHAYDLTLLLIPIFLLAWPILDSAPEGWRRNLALSATAAWTMTPFLWWLAMRGRGFCWIALLLLFFAASVGLVSFSNWCDGRGGVQSGARAQ